MHIRRKTQSTVEDGEETLGENLKTGEQFKPEGLKFALNVAEKATVKASREGTNCLDLLL